MAGGGGGGQRVLGPTWTMFGGCTHSWLNTRLRLALIVLSVHHPPRARGGPPPCWLMLPPPGASPSFVRGPTDAARVCRPPEHRSPLPPCGASGRRRFAVVLWLRQVAGPEELFDARWSDFGLAVVLDRDMGLGGSWRPLTEVTWMGLKEQVVKWWYCTQKLVPRPKWAHRRPPENCFLSPKRADLSAYDTYMLGIIFVSMATGVDWPHIEKVRRRLLRGPSHASLGGPAGGGWVGDADVQQCVEGGGVATSVNFVGVTSRFQSGHEISHAKSRGFRAMPHTLAAETGRGRGFTTRNPEVSANFPTAKFTTVNFTWHEIPPPSRGGGGGAQEGERACRT